MRKKVLKLVMFPVGATLAIALSSPAFADDDHNDRCGVVAQGKRLSIKEITQKAQARGFKVQYVKVDDGCYEIYAIDKNGIRIEARFNPVTGALISTDRED